GVVGVGLLGGVCPAPSTAPLPAALPAAPWFTAWPSVSRSWPRRAVSTAADPLAAADPLPAAAFAVIGAAPPDVAAAVSCPPSFALEPEPLVPIITTAAAAAAAIAPPAIHTAGALRRARAGAATAAPLSGVPDSCVGSGSQISFAGSGNATARRP